MSAPGPRRAAVTLFCGGRGAAPVVRELLACGAEVSLVVNGYDDGHSTGRLRGFIPGMLGPSDFRKNLGHHLRADRPADAALHRLLELRLARTATCDSVAALASALTSQRRLPARQRWIADLPADARAAVAADLAAFDHHHRSRGGGFDFADCALVNLVIAGAHLRCDRDFNAALRAVARVFRFPGRLLNVTDGSNAVLVALKTDGQLLGGEAEIVGPQSRVPIERVFLLREPLSARRRAMLQALPAAGRRAWLAAHDTRPPLDGEAARAVRDADLLVYCPGTPHSSLLPTYLTRGLGTAVRDSRAVAKVLLVNLREDHDTPGMDAPDLVRRTLAALGDPHNRTGVVTHVVYDRAQRGASGAVGVPAAVADAGTALGCAWVAGDLAAADATGTHSGPRTVRALAAIHAALMPRTPQQAGA